jgi:tetratricopeptide (TPR) repeat protein
VDLFAQRPVGGGGAGASAPWWLEHNTIGWFARNAHSLWLETLAELGIVGLALLLGAFAIGLGAGVRRLRSGPDDVRMTIAALVAATLAFMLGSGIDWVWQIPAVAGMGLVTLGLLCGSATAVSQGRSIAAHRRLGARSAVVIVVAWAAIAAQATTLLSRDRLEVSQEAARRGDFTKAAEDARTAAGIQPWAASPRSQLALIAEQRDDLDLARAEIDRALERSSSDWALWLVAARLATKDGDIPAARAALAEARRLNPRSPALRRAGR